MKTLNARDFIGFNVVPESGRTIAESGYSALGRNPRAGKDDHFFGQLQRIGYFKPHALAKAAHLKRMQVNHLVVGNGLWAFSGTQLPRGYLSVTES